MWIHLHHGDSGLEEFINFMASKAEYVVLEPQPWKCYKSAIKRMKKLDCKGFTQFQNIKYRENVDQVIEQLMLKSGMELVKCFGETSWERRICLYKYSHVLYDDR